MVLTLGFGNVQSMNLLSLGIPKIIAAASVCLFWLDSRLQALECKPDDVHNIT